jgi:hypothetical protein
MSTTTRYAVVAATPPALVASFALAVSSPIIHAQDGPKPPVCKRVPHTQEWHGTKFEDP